MNLSIYVSSSNEIKFIDDTLIINIKDINNLKNKDYKELVEFMFNDNKVVQSLNFIEYFNTSIYKCIFNEMTIDDLRSELEENSIVLFSIIISLTSHYKNIYEALNKNKIDDIYIECDKNSFLDVINLFGRCNVNCTVKCMDASLKDFNDMLNNVNLDNLNICIDYQEENTPLNIKELYNLSLLLKEIVDDIGKYNLSDLEKIMYVYDFVKYRIYNKDKNNYLNNRDLDKVIKGDNIVCSGYSNLFNAILTSLNIKTMPIISYKANHQRSIVYVKDSKYNIDGMYVFDPTWDCRKEENDTYIHKYNYFMMPLRRSKISAYDNVSELLETDMNKISCNLKKINVSFDERGESFNVCYRMRELFDFAEIMVFDGYDDIIDVIINNYDKLMDKYDSKELGYVDFFKLLYNVRRIQYCNGIIDDIDIDELVDTLKIRYDRIVKTKNINLSKMDLVFEIITMNTVIDEQILDNIDVLEKNITPNGIGIERDITNIKLIKTLRKVHK